MKPVRAWAYADPSPVGVIDPREIYEHATDIEDAHGGPDEVNYWCHQVVIRTAEDDRARSEALRVLAKWTIKANKAMEDEGRFVKNEFGPFESATCAEAVEVYERVNGLLLEADGDIFEMALKVAQEAEGE